MRLIDGDALVREISVSHTMTDDCGIKTGYEICMRLVEDAPTIELERKTGRWIFTHMFTENGASFPGYECSECDEWHGTNAYRYCPNCGAYMGGEQDGSD